MLHILADSLRIASRMPDTTNTVPKDHRSKKRYREDQRLMRWFEVTGPK